MTTMCRIAWGAALAAALSVTLAAQQAPTGYHSISCVKVKPGKNADFATLINGDVRKLEQSRVDSGAIAGWIALRTIMPAGSDAPCDYAVVTFYNGLPNAPLTGDELAAALKKAGVTATLDEWREEHAAAGTLVYDNITQYQTLVGEAKEGDYLVFNSMSVPDVDAWIAYENKVWKPLAEAMVKDGVEDGWALNVQIFPTGAKDRSLESTVDIFPSWDAFLQADQHYMEHWKTVHPDLAADDALAQFNKLCTIESTVLYKVEIVITTMHQ
ncbi:MAG: hypothetical protein WCC14_20575 [Acidobacteriaceae bacterium]